MPGREQDALRHRFSLAPLPGFQPCQNCDWQKNFGSRGRGCWSTYGQPSGRACHWPTQTFTMPPRRRNSMVVSKARDVLKEILLTPSADRTEDRSMIETLLE